MEPRDFPAVERLHNQQNQRDGTHYPLTRVFDECGRPMPNVALAMVVVDGDEIKQGVIFERAVEMMLAGIDPKATATLHREIGAAFYLLRLQQYELVNCFIPKQVVLRVEKPLKDVGFRRNDGRLALFQKDLTQTESEESHP